MGTPSTLPRAQGGKEEIRASALPLPAWELRRQAGRRPKVKRREPWTASDVALLDEATALITGEVSTYGHVVVDSELSKYLYRYRSDSGILVARPLR